MILKIGRNILWTFCVLLIWVGCVHIRSFQRVNTPRNKISIPKHAEKYPVFTKADSMQGRLNRYRQFDVKSYELKLNIGIDRHYLEGAVTMTFKAERSLDTLQVDLYRPLAIKKIIFQGDSLDFERRLNAYYVFLPKSLSSGKTYKLHVLYEGHPREAERPPWKGGLVWENDEKNNPWVGVACEAEGASLWWPCKDHVGDEPDSVSVQITVPDSLVAVGNGRLRKLVEQDEQRTYKWVVKNPINLYNITFYIGDYKALHTPYILGGDTNQLTLYTLSYHEAMGRQLFSQVKDVMAFFEEKFGTYPWWEDGYKLVDAPYAGMEHQTAIAYGSFSFSVFNLNNRDLPFDYILVHETAHEWWGNSVTASDMAHLWIHEGLATYSEVLYLEHKRDYDRSVEYLNNYKSRIDNKYPLVKPEQVRYFNYKDVDIYAKGAWVIHTLRSVINADTLFFKILKSFAGKHRKSLIQTEDFINHVETVTGRSWDAFFQQYLYQRYPPVLAYALGKDYFYFKWDHVNDQFKMPVEIYLDDELKRIHPMAGKVNKIPLQGAEEIVINTDRFYLRTAINTSLLP